MNARIDPTTELPIERMLETTRRYFAADYEALHAPPPESQRGPASGLPADRPPWAAEFAQRRNRQRARRAARSQLWATA